MKSIATFEDNDNQLFLKNMSILKHATPSLYSFFKNYTPKNAIITKDQTNNPNIKILNEWLYHEPAENHCTKQVTFAIQKPEYFHTILAQNTERDRFCFLQQHALLDLQNIAYSSERQPKNDYFSPSIIFAGIGLGYQINMLLEHKSFHDIYLFEPNTDFFYASLHSIDYKEILNEKKQHRVHFIIGQDFNALLQQIIEVNNKHGIQSCTQMQITMHYKSNQISQMINQVHDFYPKIYSSNGFIEDESIGISHFYNTLAHYPDRKILTDLSTTHTRSEYAFIVGSGPSIDQHIDKIKQLSNKAIIFSCSSSIEILHKNGISPDFHVEVERTDGMTHRLNELNDPDYLKKITLLSLNTTHPNLTPYFKNHITALKQNDAGQIIFNTLCPDQFILKNCNPTSGNGAVAFANALGFKNIVFFGLDMGQKSNTYHHSKDTLYYRSDSFKLNSISSHRKVKANFGGEIETTKMLMNALNAIETLIRTNSDITCFNCSDGAFIEGSKPLTIEELAYKFHNINEIDKNQILNELESQCSPALPSSTEGQSVILNSYKSSWLNTLTAAQKIITNAIKPVLACDSLKSYFEFLEKSHQILKQEMNEDPLMILLLSGSYTAFTLTTSTALLVQQNNHSISKIIKNCLEINRFYYENVFKLCVENFAVNNEKIKVSTYCN